MWGVVSSTHVEPAVRIGEVASMLSTAMPIDANTLAVSAGLTAALGHYRLIAEMGRGRLANVFLALFRNADGTSRQVVLKQLQSELALDQDFRAMFENEAHLATRFQHDNVVKTYDIYNDRELCVLVMEFLHGQALARVRERASQGSEVPLPIQMPFSIHLRVLADALAGLHYVHELTDTDGTPLGIVHRDVTPSNVFVTYDGRVKLTGFGMATATTRDPQTRMEALKGDLAYTSPEVARNQRVDRRTDIFSVGVMLWEAATGRRLWQEQEPVKIYRRLLTGDLSIYVPGAHGTSADMLRIAQRALAVDPSERYATAEQMRLELEDLMAGMGKTTQRPALADYMDAYFSAERRELQTVIDEALARFSSCAITQNSRVQKQVRRSYPPPYPSEPPTKMASPLAGGNTFRTSSSAYDVVEHVRETPNFRRGVYRGFGIAFTAVVAATAIAYASRAPDAASAAAAGRTPITLDSAASQAPSGANSPAPQSTTASPSAPVMPAQAGAVTAPASGAILAVFVARPPHARLSLDGVPLEANPATIRRQPDDKQHLLRVEAAGYATIVRTIELDRDIAKEFELVPEGTLGPTAPGTGSSIGARSEVPKTPPAKGAAVRDDPWGI
jgi:serine/threonine protein kinase